MPGLRDEVLLVESTRVNFAAAILSFSGNSVICKSAVLPVEVFVEPY